MRYSKRAEADAFDSLEDCTVIIHIILIAYRLDRLIAFLQIPWLEPIEVKS